MTAVALPGRFPYSSARAHCYAAIERRFGWLIADLERANGNLSALPEHKQILWHGRARVVKRFNRIGELRDPLKRDRAYQRLTKELER